MFESILFQVPKIDREMQFLKNKKEEKSFVKLLEDFITSGELKNTTEEILK